MDAPIEPDSFGFLVNDVARLTRLEMDRRVEAAGLGLTNGEARTLIHAQRSGAVRQSILAERMGVEAMTCSSALDKLEAKGLIERRPDAADRRAKTVHLTAEGAAAIARIGPVAATVRRDASAGIDTAEWQLALAVLKKARTALMSAREAALAEQRADLTEDAA